ncbi:peptidase dimerization domain-containing protein [Actinomadura madurae]|uniref:peptidase dimerization domain-containing protein n=1 Tax=Actinomadura madurae TaxID=1993 RepID=UPI003FD773D5
MKAGLAMAFRAAAGLDGVTLLVTGDEEIGSPSSRALIEREARATTAALVFEASADGGALKTERKGAARYEIRVAGRAAHAGLEPERGVNATVQLAHQVLAVSVLADREAGTTVTPTVARAGTTANTVPADGAFAVDVRARTVAEQERVDRALRALGPTVPGARVETIPGPKRPPPRAGGLGTALWVAVPDRRGAGTARAVPGRRRWRIRREPHRRRRHAHPGRPRRGRRRRARRRRARPRRGAAGADGVGARAGRTAGGSLTGSTRHVHRGTAVTADELRSRNAVTERSERTDSPGTVVTGLTKETR